MSRPSDGEALRLAASRWLERLEDGEERLDYEGQAEQLARLLAEPEGLYGREVGSIDELAKMFLSYVPSRGVESARAAAYETVGRWGLPVWAHRDGDCQGGPNCYASWGDRGCRLPEPRVAAQPGRKG